MKYLYTSTYNTPELFSRVDTTNYNSSHISKHTMNWHVLSVNHMHPCGKSRSNNISYTDDANLTPDNK